jgi:hypothetical protein
MYIFDLGEALTGERGRSEASPLSGPLKRILVPGPCPPPKRHRNAQRESPPSAVKFVIIQERKTFLTFLDVLAVDVSSLRF